MNLTTLRKCLVHFLYLMGGKVKRQTREIFEIHSKEKGLIFLIYKDLLQLNKRQIFKDKARRI